MKIFMLSFVFGLLLGLVALGHSDIQMDIDEILSELHIEEEDFQPALRESTLQKILQKVLGYIDPISMPFIPTIAFNPSDKVDVSLILTDVFCTGLSEIEVVLSGIDINVIGNNELMIDLLIPQLKLTSQEYIAGGHILNLPFAGKSFLYVSLEQISLNATVEFSTFHLRNYFEFCLGNGTTSLTVDIGKTVVYFNDLDPGTDQGSLINSIFEASMQDIADALAKWYPGSKLDQLFVAAFNKLLCRPFTRPSGPSSILQQ